ncbi:aminotransferase class III-fold pyridoxal phosphate-dependent enzyme [Maribacter aestuarii]|uniref:aminotransferase class III-fold pyridoxal phosphate-dependent enzyme n=1 Tax=Maribacter aestuarii TaxID=1130723 RepID=UPI0025A6837A|nr:aminotransferase class III-fold pyridoxal phosphate-dependent enzyme [Maribacter aestuarii]
MIAERKVLKVHYGLSDIVLSKLEGYDSINYKVCSPTNSFVLKVYPFSDELFALLEGEEKVLTKLRKANGIEVPFTILNSNGTPYTIIDNSLYRLLPFLEGKFISEVEHSTEILESFGKALALMDKSLLGLYDAALHGKEIQWDLKYFKKNKRFLEEIDNPMDRSLVHYFFLHFDENIYPIQDTFRKSIIHNDANDWNVLTQNGRVSGIIDFGDMCSSWLINELAVGLTYMLMGKEEPLKVAAVIIQTYHSYYPLLVHEIDALYYLIAARLSTSVCNSAHAKKQKPNSEYITISEKPAWDLLRKWIQINPILAKDTLRAACSFEKTQKQDLEKQLVQRKRNFSGALSMSYSHPIQMSRSAFQYMYDTNGNTFLDAYNNIMQVGHCHPKVVEAGQRTLARLNTNTRYLYDEFLSYSEKLLAKLPPSLNKVFFVNSGSAATDLAIRMAKAHTKKKKIMVLEHGYHGNTQNGIDISHYKYNHKGGSGKANNIVEAPLPKVFESGFKNENDAAAHFVKETFSRITENEGEIAAFIAEPIVGCGGQVPLPRNYLNKIYPKIRAQGGICISDEVQVGFGRLGAFFWGYEMYDVVPDMVILGKPMGNGHPIGAVVTTTEISDSFDNGMEFFSSFGGNPVSCAIGEAVLDVIETENLQEQARLVGKYLKDELKTLVKNYQEVADVRGEGLFLGVELLDQHRAPGTKLANILKNRLRDNHILVSTDGPYDNVLKIKPPLYFNRQNVNQLINEMDLILGETLKI